MAIEKEFVFSWKIKNLFMTSLKVGKRVKSPSFSAENIGGSRWCLQIFPGGESKQTKDYVGCFLTRNKDCHYSKEQIIIDFAILLYIDDKMLSKYECEDKIFKRLHSIGEKRFYKVSELHETLIKYYKDKVTLVCILKNTKSLLSNRCESKYLFKTYQVSYRRSFSFPDSSDWMEFTQCNLRDTDCEIVLSAPIDNIIITILNVDYTAIATCRISVLDIYGVKQISDSNPNVLDISGDLEITTFISRKEIENKKEIFIRDGKFTLLFECTCVKIDSTNYHESLKYNYNPKIKVDTTDISFLSDFQTLLAAMKYSDVEIRCADKLLFAHKSILSSRSPVFYAMFDLNMSENRTGIVNCYDISSEIMSSFIEFLYIGTVSQTNYDNMLDLLLVADKYQVASLRDECASYLLSAISAETVLEIIEIADLTEMESLKRSAMDFISECSSVILSSSQWLLLIEVNVKLSSEIICRLVQLKDDFNNRP